MSSAPGRSEDRIIGRVLAGLGAGAGARLGDSLGTLVFGRDVLGEGAPALLGRRGRSTFPLPLLRHVGVRKIKYGLGQRFFMRRLCLGCLVDRVEDCEGCEGLEDLVESFVELCCGLG